MAAPATVSPAHTSLYVAGLHPTVGEVKLYELFSTIGDLCSVMIFKDMLTGVSLCYGYVNFVRAEDAALAIEKLNNTRLSGKLIRVMWSAQNGDARKGGAAKIFVKNLVESIDNSKLYDIFCNYGKILSCKVALGLDSKSRGYGFVQFESEQAANMAVEHANGTIIEGKEMYVTYFVEKCDRESSSSGLTNLYLKNLDKALTVEFLNERFSVYGKIKNQVILKDVYGISRGVGFIEFFNSADAARAIAALNGTILGSRIVYVDWAEKKEDHEQMPLRQYKRMSREKLKKDEGLIVYIKNIEYGVTDDELGELFSQCGTVDSSRIMRDAKGRSRGFGFVSFSTTEEVSVAVDSLDGYIFHGRPIYVMIAEDKEVRQAKWQLQCLHRLAAINTAAASAEASSTSVGYPYYAYYAATPAMISDYFLQPFGIEMGNFESD